MDFKDYYATLGVPKTASEKEIKAAFRRLARKHHPDVNPGDKAAESRFKDINEAYEVLGDADKRRKYDELGANWRAYEQAGAGGPGGGPFGGWNVNMGGAPGGGGSGFRTMSPEEMEGMFGEGMPFSDFFTTFFGGAGPGAGASGGRGAGRGAAAGGGRQRAARPRAGRDVEHELELTLEDAFHGTTRRLSLAHGHGGADKTVDVRIPAGVNDGSRVRVAGEGEPGGGGGPAGDLYLRIRLAPHATFERKGRDVYVSLPVPVTTAVLGGEAQVPTLAGTTVRLRIPELTQNGQLFRLKGYGMPAVGKPDEKGDAYARITVQLPKELSATARDHYQALAKLEGAS